MEKERKMELDLGCERDTQKVNRRDARKQKFSKRSDNFKRMRNYKDFDDPRRDRKYTKQHFNELI